MSLPLLTGGAPSTPAPCAPHVRGRVHLPDLPPGSILGCAHGRGHHAHWYFSEAAGGRYLCRACHAWAIRRYVGFAHGEQPQGAVRINEFGDMRVVR